MGSGNWIVDNLNSALEMWNGRLDGNLAAHHHIAGEFQGRRYLECHRRYQRRD